MRRQPSRVEPFALSCASQTGAPCEAQLKPVRRIVLLRTEFPFIATLLSPIPGRRGRPMQLQGEMDKKLFDEQSLRLPRAFFSLQDTEVRAIIVNLVESTARGEGIPADGLREQLHGKSS